MQRHGGTIRGEDSSDGGSSLSASSSAPRPEDAMSAIASEVGTLPARRGRRPASLGPAARRCSPASRWRSRDRPARLADPRADLRSFVGGQAEIKANTAIAGILAGVAVLIEAFGVPGRRSQGGDHAWHRGGGDRPRDAHRIAERADLGIDRFLFADSSGRRPACRPDGSEHRDRFAADRHGDRPDPVQRRPLLRQIFALARR